MNIIAIDDEPLALSIINEFCQRLGNICLQTFTDPMAGMAAVAEQRPDLLLLDIRLGTANGVSLARQLPGSTSLIFTTAYTEYALDAFEIGAIDYLHKPFAFERFASAIDRAHRRCSAKSSITLKADYKCVVIPVADILYIEAMDNYVRLHLVDDRYQMSKTTLTSLLDQLPAELFIRIHKSFVVARSHISRYTAQQVFIRGIERPLPIGRTFVDEVRRELRVEG